MKEVWIIDFLKMPSKVVVKKETKKQFYVIEANGCSYRLNKDDVFYTLNDAVDFCVKHRLERINVFTRNIDNFVDNISVLLGMKTEVECKR